MVDVASARWPRGGRNRIASTAWLLISLSLLLVGCGGGGGGDSAPAPVVSGPSEVPAEVSLSGILQYEYVPPHDNCLGLNFSETVPRPIRGATLQLIDAATDQVLATDVATDTGAYSFVVESERQVRVRVRTELKRTGSPSWDVELRDNTRYTTAPLASRPMYALESSSFDTGTGDRTLNLRAATGWDGNAYSQTRAAAPFAILDIIYESMSLILSAEPDARFAPLDVFWSVNNSTLQSGNIDAGEIGTSYYRPDIDSLFLLGKADDDTEEFDGLVIAHEWAHYFEDNLSRSDSMGGSHGLNQRLDMRLAFGEGWASALAGMVTGSDRYCDTAGFQQQAGFGFDLERDSTSPRGWFNELSVVSILYDLWDSRVGDDDGGSLGFPAIYEVFASDQVTTPAFTSLFSYMSALKARNPGQAGFIDALLTGHSVNGVDAYGSNEINSGGGTDALPVYTEITPDGSPVVLCSNSEFDNSRDGNKLGEYRYVKLRLDTPGSYEVNVATRTPPSVPLPGYDCRTSDSNRHSYSDPDFLLVRNGQIVLAGQSCEANEEIATSDSLPAGDYVMSLLEYRFADENTPTTFPSRICFDVSISPAP